MAVAKIKVDVEGSDITLSIGYELFGEGRPWILTPGGGFFSRQYHGVRELAVALAELGNKVVIWDKPNTGESDVCFAGSSVSTLQADFLAGLLRHLGMAPAMIIGGSAGSRVSVLAAARHREVARGLAVWWITGGVYGRMAVGTNYGGPSIAAAWNGGMEAVVELPQWRESVETNPGNRQRLLDQDPKEFIATMERWMLKYAPSDDQTIPGLPDSETRTLDLPALVFRSGASDALHTRATSERLAALLPNSRLVEPPWPDTEWNDTSGLDHFRSWPRLAPILHEWAERTFG
jgi:pimeloyl-ACP methyl ester carboxylesterase